MNRPHTIIIAEAGVNHNGSLERAKALIDAAKTAGVDYVKFQTFKASKLVTKKAKKAAYQIQNTAGEDSQFDMLKSLELSEEDHYTLKDYCEKQGVTFLSTAFDLDSIDFLTTLGIDLFKIPSGEITNLPYLEKIAQQGLQVVLSTGMADMDEIEAAVEAIVKAGTDIKDITVLHCNTQYPTPMVDVNLTAMNTIGKKLGVNIGYSDHTLGIEIPIAAVALGATVIEKHFTLDRNLPGPDHKASLEPDELKAMVDGIRNIELAMGSGLKEPSPSEIGNKTVARKSIHTAKKLQKGQTLSLNDLVMKRPGSGITPMKVNEVIGKTLLQDLDEDEMLKWEVIN